MMNIQNLKSTISNYGGLAKASKFYVTITGRRRGGNAGFERDAQFLCDTAVLPGISFQTTEVRQQGYGNVDKRPYMTMFQDISTIFLCDAKGEVINYFHSWFRGITNFNEAGGNSINNEGLRVNLFNYPEEYWATVEIHTLNDAGDEIIKYTLTRAYPLAIGEVSVAWDQTDTITKLPVTWAYNSWNSEKFTLYETSDFRDRKEELQLRTSRQGYTI